MYRRDARGEVGGSRGKGMREGRARVKDGALIEGVQGGLAGSREADGRGVRPGD